MSIHLLVTVTDSGIAEVRRVSYDGANEARQYEDPTFTKAVLNPGDILTTHVNVDPHKRLLRILLDDDVVPKFASIEEAEAWMESRVGEVIS